MKNFCFLTLIIAVNFTSSAQFILAGRHSPTDFYYDFVPDTEIERHNSGSFVIDINNDKVYDFYFAFSPGSGSLGMGSYSCRAVGLNGNSIAVSYLDYCYDNNNNFKYTRQIASAYNDNDIIDSAATWMGIAYLEYEDWYTGSYDCRAEFATDTAYIGLRIMKGTQPFYGWIKISLLNLYYPGSIYFLDIGGYACNAQTTGISVVNQESPEWKIYSNPSSDKLTVESSQKAIVDLLSIEGQQIRSFIMNDRKINIDISTLAEGIYILRLKTKNEIYSKKFIKG